MNIYIYIYIYIYIAKWGYRRLLCRQHDLPVVMYGNLHWTSYTDINYDDSKTTYNEGALFGNIGIKLLFIKSNSLDNHWWEKVLSTRKKWGTHKTYHCDENQQIISKHIYLLSSGTIGGVFWLIWHMILLQWRHGVSNHQCLDCLLNRLFRRR